VKRKQRKNNRKSQKRKRKEKTRERATLFFIRPSEKIELVFHWIDCIQNNKQPQTKKKMDSLDVKIRKLQRSLSPERELTKEAVDALVSLYTKFEENADAIVAFLSSKNELRKVLNWAFEVSRKDHCVADVLIEEILLSVNELSTKQWKELTVRDDNCITHISLEALNAGIKKDASIQEILKEKTIQNYLSD